MQQQPALHASALNLNTMLPSMLGTPTFNLAKKYRVTVPDDEDSLAVADIWEACFVWGNCPEPWVACMTRMPN